MENQHVLRPIVADDLEGYIQLIHAVGWSRSIDPSSGDWAYNERQFKLFLAIGNLFGHEHEGRLISCAGLFPFGTELASVGMVMVHPDYQRQGLGNQLMQRCLELSNGMPLVLVATEMGEPVYRSVGFHTVEKIRRFVLEGDLPVPGADADRKIETNASMPQVVPITEADLAEIIEADHHVIGADRSLFYHAQFACTDIGFLIRNATSGKIEAFALGLERKDLHALALGPFYATTIDAALQLLHHLHMHWQGSLRINVLEHQEDFIAELLRLGFHEVNVSPLMIHGATALSVDRSRLYGIADPALG